MCHDEFLHRSVLFRKNVGDWKAGGEPHALPSGSNIASSSIITSTLDGRRGLGNSGLSGKFSVQIDSLDLVI